MNTFTNKLPKAIIILVMSVRPSVPRGTTSPPPTGKICVNILNYGFLLKLVWTFQIYFKYDKNNILHIKIYSWILLWLIWLPKLPRACGCCSNLCCLDRIFYHCYIFPFLAMVMRIRQKCSAVRIFRIIMNGKPNSNLDQLITAAIYGRLFLKTHLNPCMRSVQS